jgi:SecD/SecF fusion protein
MNRFAATALGTFTGLALLAALPQCEKFRSTCENPPKSGLRLVFAIDTASIEPASRTQLPERVADILRSRARSLGIYYPFACIDGRDRITLYLPAKKMTDMAPLTAMGTTGLLEFCLLREPATLVKAVAVIDTTVNNGDTMSLKRTGDPNRAKAERLLAGENGERGRPSLFSGMLSMLPGDHVGVRLHDKAAVDSILSRADVRAALDRAGLGSNRFLWSHETISQSGELYRMLYYVKDPAEMRGDAVADARASLDHSGFSAGSALVDLNFNKQGTLRFAAVTAANVNKFLAIVIDSVVYSAPRIMQEIPGGRAEITGHFTMEEAKSLAIILRAGALPAPLRIVEQRWLGAQ